MNAHRTVAAAIALLVVAAGGCGSEAPTQTGHHPVSSAAPSRVSSCPAAAVVERREPAPWPSRTVLRESLVESISSQVVNSAARAVYLLVSKTNTPVRGSWVLCRITLLSGAARQGPAFPAGSLALASGHLWDYGAPGPGSRPVVTEVNPLTGLRVRQIPLATVPASFGGVPAAVTAGPAGSLWIGSYRTLLRVSATTGTTLARVIVKTCGSRSFRWTPFVLCRPQRRGFILVAAGARRPGRRVSSSGGAVRG
jgi:hypothetical protein